MTLDKEVAIYGMNSKKNEHIEDGLVNLGFEKHPNLNNIWKRQKLYGDVMGNQLVEMVTSTSPSIIHPLIGNKEYFAAFFYHFDSRIKQTKLLQR